jgi:two-component system sensor histidine kinase MprB
VTLRSRVIAIVTVLVIVGVGLASLAAYRATQSELVDETDRFLTTRADELVDGQRLPPPNPRDDRDGSRGDDDRDENDRNDGGSGSDDLKLASDPDALSQTIDRNGDITATSDRDLPVTDVDRAVAKGGTSVIRDITIDESPYRMITSPDEPAGAVQVARDVSATASVLDGLRLRLGIIAVVVAVAAALIGWLLMRKTTEPLEDLAAAAERVALTRDLTPLDLNRSDEVGRLADSFDRMLGALALSRDQQQRLVQDAAHELRTPLTSLRANIEFLDRVRELPEDELDELLGGLNEEVAELTTLFDELVQLASETDDDVPAQECDLAEVVADAVERFQRRSGRVVTVAAEPTPVSGNPAQLDRAVTNLLGNADKFSPTGEPIAVTLADRTVTVSDHGPGIDSADQAHVFDRFYRSSTARSEPGSGLGLAIVRQIAEQHGGTVTVADAPGGGAAVGFTVA